MTVAEWILASAFGALFAFGIGFVIALFSGQTDWFNW